MLGTFSLQAAQNIPKPGTSRCWSSRLAKLFLNLFATRIDMLRIRAFNYSIHLFDALRKRIPNLRAGRITANNAKSNWPKTLFGVRYAFGNQNGLTLAFEGELKQNVRVGVLIQQLFKVPCDTEAIQRVTQSNRKDCPQSPTTVSPI